MSYEGWAIFSHFAVVGWFKFGRCWLISRAVLFIFLAFPFGWGGWGVVVLLIHPSSFFLPFRTFFMCKELGFVRHEACWMSFR